MAPQPLGAVLDFGALRCWFVDCARAHGAQLQLGSCVLTTEPAAQGMQTLIRHQDGKVEWVKSRWVVDATGERRALLGEPDAKAGSLISGHGVEWLLQVREDDEWERWSDRLAFFLGSAWVPYGYGWVFPMGGGRLKVGACRLQGATRNPSSLGQALSRLLRHSRLDGARVLDRHGGRIRSTITRRESHGRGRLVGLGDAVSTANLLGGEGIRHALASADQLSPLLVAAVIGNREADQDPSQLQRLYRKRLQRELGWRWNLSGRLACRTWLGLGDGDSNSPGDQRLEQLLRSLQNSKAEDLSALLFDYRFERYGLKALPYLCGWR